MCFLLSRLYKMNLNTIWFCHEMDVSWQPEQGLWVFILFRPPSCLLCLSLFRHSLPPAHLSILPSLSLTFTQSPQSYWPWFLLICIHHFSFFGIWRWGTFPSLSEFTAISLCVFSKGLGYEMHIKYPLIPHYPTDKITMIMRQKF